MKVTMTLVIAIGRCTAAVLLITSTTSVLYVSLFVKCNMLCIVKLKAWPAVLVAAV